MTEFDITDLGIDAVQGAAGNFLYQKKCMLEILDKFKMKGCNSVSSQDLMLTQKCSGNKVDSTLYKQIVGSLMYLIATRPDIMHVVSLVSCYMESPTEVHLHATKRILRYLSGTIDYDLFYKKGVKSGLFWFSDSDYAGDPNDRKSTSGYIFMMGSTAIS
ncbi:secreted RxLR effector protein 161-like [Actinidia eriantha]|uniref:secreted RxLR effector protein 161-like n=1 Tax=Actinidia eriantha TaxID=165200 RepID=UPI00258777FB|nr:secreted RxLR effector protein 161-like [Actinidia eriantha]